MSTTYQPDIIAETGLIPLVDDLQITPPIIYHTVAGQWHAESGTAIQNGRLHEHKGDIYGTGQIKPQDTYITGSAGRSGRPFSVVSGTVKDDVILPEFQKYGLLMPNGSSGASFEVVDTSGTTAGMLPALIIIRSGVPGVGSTPTAANTFLYLEFNYGDPSTKYRLSLEYGRPIRVDFYSPTQTFGNWREFCVARGADAIFDTYLQQHNGELRVRVDPDNKRGIVSFEIGGVMMRHSPQRPIKAQAFGGTDATASLPTYDNYRFYGQNRWAELYVFPFRFETMKVTKSPRSVGSSGIMPWTAPATGKVIPNVAGGAETGQTYSSNIYLDGNGLLSWDMTTSLPDAGDGLGSTLPPRLSDVMVYIPAQWAQVPAGVPIRDAFPRTVKVKEYQVWDDANREGRTWGNIWFDNSNGRYSSGALGQYALRITASNGITYGTRVSGMMGHGEDGIQIERMDPGWNLLNVPWSDNFAKMDRQLGQEIILDGVALPAAIRLLCQIGQISPKYLTRIPDVGFPSDYGGQYPSNFPYFILPKGTGLNPKLRFDPRDTVHNVLRAIIADSGEPLNSLVGSVTPYYMFFDPFGNFHVDLYNPGTQYAAKFYSSYDPTGAGQIIDEPMVIMNSVSQLATDLDVIGQDAFTYELLQAHRDLSYNLPLVGYRKPVIERNERYSSPAYAERIADVLKIQASLGVQVVRIKVPFDPFVFAGNLVGVSDDKVLGGTFFYTVMAMESEYGFEPLTGQAHCHSVLTLRSLQNSLVF